MVERTGEEHVDLDRFNDGVSEVRPYKSKDAKLEERAQKKAEKKAAEEMLTEQRMEEYSYTFKGEDLKSVTDSFIAKMSSLSSTMSSVSGFDMKA